MREELKESREKTGKTEDELHDVKEALTAARKRTHCQSSNCQSGSSTASSRDPHQATLLAELTAKLQEANETYAKVVKDVDALKKENGALKEEKVSFCFVKFSFHHLLVSRCCQKLYVPYSSHYSPVSHLDLKPAP